MAIYEEAIYDKALDLYLAKIATGKYEHYSRAMLGVLFADCARQVMMMNRCNEVRNEIHN